MELKELFQLIKRLSEAHGVVGYEDEVAKIMHEEMADWVDEIYRDNVGNLIAKKGKGKPVYLLAAHMDEIGFVVKYIDKDGFIWFVPVGGFYEPTIMNRRVVILGEKGKVYGVIGIKPPHVMEEEERKKVLPWKEMFIDVGASNKEEVEKLGVKVGSPICFDADCKLISFERRITGKALDDRVGCAILCALMRELEDFKGTLYAIGTIQEEIGLRGAKVAAKLKPDVALAVDVNICGDHPGIEAKHSPIGLGKGPSIEILQIKPGASESTVMHKKVVDWLVGTANEFNIPYQLNVGFGGLTDAAAMFAEGIMVGSVGVPARYIHTPIEVVDLDDVDATIKLLKHAIESGIKIG